jgi:hypothetical protein
MWATILQFDNTGWSITKNKTKQNDSLYKGGSSGEEAYPVICRAAPTFKIYNPTQRAGVLPNIGNK